MILSMGLDNSILTTNDKLLIVIVVAASLMFAGAMVLALAWGVRDGQFENFTRSAQAIFDPDEPIGEATDGFPGQPQRRPSRPGLIRPAIEE